jgi:hypothetical protein
MTSVCTYCGNPFSLVDSRLDWYIQSSSSLYPVFRDVSCLNCAQAVVRSVNLHFNSEHTCFNEVNGIPDQVNAQQMSFSRLSDHQLEVLIVDPNESQVDVYKEIIRVAAICQRVIRPHIWVNAFIQLISNQILSNDKFTPLLEAITYSNVAFSNEEWVLVLSKIIEIWDGREYPNHQILTAPYQQAMSCLLDLAKRRRVILLPREFFQIFWKTHARLREEVGGVFLTNVFLENRSDFLAQIVGDLDVKLNNVLNFASIMHWLSINKDEDAFIEIFSSFFNNLPPDKQNLRQDFQNMMQNPYNIRPEVIARINGFLIDLDTLL